jgi:hypothetical protein
MQLKYQIDLAVKAMDLGGNCYLAIAGDVIPWNA